MENWKSKCLKGIYKVIFFLGYIWGANDDNDGFKRKKRRMEKISFRRVLRNKWNRICITVKVHNNNLAHTYIMIFFSRFLLFILRGSRIISLDVTCYIDSFHSNVSVLLRYCIIVRNAALYASVWINAERGNINWKLNGL